MQNLCQDPPTLSEDNTPTLSLHHQGCQEGPVFYQHGVRRICVRKFNCVLCMDIFTTQEELNKHFANSHQEFKFICRHCKKQYKSVNGCAKPEAAHARLVFECEFCQKKFQFPKALKNHRKIHTHHRLYQCTNSPQKYTTNCAMLQHAQKHQLACPKCKKSVIHSKIWINILKDTMANIGNYHVANTSCGIQWSQNIEIGP